MKFSHFKWFFATNQRLKILIHQGVGIFLTLKNFSILHLVNRYGTFLPFVIYSSIFAAWLIRGHFFKFQEFSRKSLFHLRFLRNSLKSKLIEHRADDYSWWKIERSNWWQKSKKQKSKEKYDTGQKNKNLYIFPGISIFFPICRTEERKYNVEKNLVKAFQLWESRG